MVQLPDAPVTVQTLAGETPTAVTRYEAGAPPDPVPFATVMVTCPLSATAVGVAGELGAMARVVTSFEGSDAAEVAEGEVEVAVAVKVYAVSLARPETVQLPVEPVIRQVLLGSPTAATVYDVGTGPALGGLMTVTVAEVAFTTAVGAEGGSTRYA